MNKSTVLDLLTEHTPQLFKQPGTVLYIGACPDHFTAGRELSQAGNELTVLEIWQPWLDELMASEQGGYVTRAVCGDIADLPDLGHFDYAVWLHGPEHLEEGAARRVLAWLPGVASTVVVACPDGWMANPQRAGNPYTKHRSGWHARDFERLGWQVAGHDGELVAWMGAGIAPQPATRNRCILVVGTGRSGTSAVAGMLHKLNVWMGAVFQPANHNNPHGTYEDAEFRSLDLMVAFDHVFCDECAARAYGRLVAKRDGHPLWGVKDPDLTRTYHHLLPHLDDVRVVVCEREREATLTSFTRAYHKSRDEAERWYADKTQCLDAMMAGVDVPVLRVQFEDVMADPAATAARLRDFAYDDLDLELPALDAAIGHVRAEPGAEGWGSVCIGVRPTRPWLLEFWSDWTGLVANGLRGDDLVLQPERALPGHQAANVVARAFLRSNCDSLLFVDDDQTFEPDALERLRENRANWEYDVVGPFVTQRTWPPRPLMLRTATEQSGDGGPGEAFEIFPQFQDLEIVEVDAIGLYFTLVRRRVLEALLDGHDLDTCDLFRYGPGMQGPDIPFSQDARGHGFRLAVDTSVKVGHVGQFEMGWEQYQNWRASGDKSTP